MLDIIVIYVVVDYNQTSATYGQDSHGQDE